MEVYKLRPWVKIVLILITSAIICLSIYQLFTMEKVDKKSGAICNGGIIKICSGTYDQYKMAN